MRLFYALACAAFIMAMSAQARGAATLDPNTWQLDIPYLLYQGPQGDVPVWARLQFMPNNEGRLLWRVADYGAATAPRRSPRAVCSGGNPIVSGDLESLAIPEVNVFGTPFAVTMRRVQMSDGSITFELRGYSRTDSQECVQGTDVTSKGFRAQSLDGQTIALMVKTGTDNNGNSTASLYILPVGGVSSNVRLSFPALSSSKKYFFANTLSIEKNRLPEAKQGGFDKQFTAVVGDEIHLSIEQASLYSPRCATESACYQGKPPVLFVHGYSLGGGFGGGDSTWGNFPKLLEAKGYAPFEFVWRTNARFEDVANDLAKAIKDIKTSTGKPVYIIAHSFGGLLSRTWLQGLASDSATPSASGLVAGLTTLGTPHSGIADKNRCLAGIALPGGQDGIGWFEGCQQASCELAGEEIFSDTMRNLFGSGLGKPMRPGELIQKLNNFNTYPLPSIDILVQIGLTSQRGVTPGNDMYLDAGDGLITYEGQRFAPSDTVQGSCFENQGSVTARDSSLRLSSVNVGGARVMEIFLGFPDTWRPGEFNLYANDGFYGYKPIQTGISFA